LCFDLHAGGLRRLGGNPIAWLDRLAAGLVIAFLVYYWSKVYVYRLLLLALLLARYGYNERISYGYSLLAPNFKQVSL